MEDGKLASIQILCEVTRVALAAHVRGGPVGESTLKHINILVFLVTVHLEILGARGATLLGELAVEDHALLVSELLL